MVPNIETYRNLWSITIQQTQQHFSSRSRAREKLKTPTTQHAGAVCQHHICIDSWHAVHVGHVHPCSESIKKLMCVSQNMTCLKKTGGCDKRGLKDMKTIRNELKAISDFEFQMLPSEHHLPMDPWKKSVNLLMLTIPKQWFRSLYIIYMYNVYMGQCIFTYICLPPIVHVGKHTID